MVFADAALAFAAHCLRFVMRSDMDQVDAMLGVFGCARATDGVVGLDSLAGWSAMNLNL